MKRQNIPNETRKNESSREIRQKDERKRHIHHTCRHISYTEDMEQKLNESLHINTD